MSGYTASKTRNEDLTGWSVIFRHPALLDPETGKRGLPMHYGLGTRNDATADRLISQLNGLLADERWWATSARQSAYSYFDERVVDIFYDEMVLEVTDSRAIRDKLMPLPTHEQGYRHVLLIGTTGAGKTTMLRQLLGTDPDEERFPTTATARTTIADAEFVLKDGSYSAVVTFFPRDEIVRHLEDCVLRAVVAVHSGQSESEVRRVLLRHRDDRFRFNYILGDEPRANSAGRSASRSVRAATSVASTGKVGAGMPELGEFPQEQTDRVMEIIVGEVFELARTTTHDLERVIDPRGAGEPQEVANLIEERLEVTLRGNDRVHVIIDGLIDEMRKRFDLIDSLGGLRCDSQGWPISWTGSTPDRSSFLRRLRRFTSNSKTGFGRLLTPLVDGVRVTGPFRPTWHQGPTPRLVFIDTEGLGHTVESAASISTKFTQLIAEADAVALVDSAAQPMQAAPATLLRSLAQTGQGSKLYLCFTHFDAVNGDNLPTLEDRTHHVRDSCDGVLAKISADLGLFADRPLRQRVSEAFFLADCQRILKREGDEFAVQQFRDLLAALAGSGAQPALAETRPVYDRVRLADAVRDAVEGFRRQWHVLLELPPAPKGEGAHWNSIKALSKRFALTDEEAHGNLKPVADLQAWLQERSWLMIQSPISWTEGEPSEADMQTLYDKFAERLSVQMLKLARERIKEQRHQQWIDAYQQAGTGSAKGRAKIIEEIYAGAAPMHQPLASQQDEFLNEVTEIVRDTAADLDIRLT